MWLLRIAVLVKFMGGTKSVRNNTSNILKMSQIDFDIYIVSDYIALSLVKILENATY